MPRSQLDVCDSAPQSGKRRSHPQNGALGSAFEPLHAVRCVGELRFRTQAVRDLACLLDLDGEVVDWTCLPPPLDSGGLSFPVDLAVRRASRTEFVTVSTRPEDFSAPEWAQEAAAARGASLRVVPVEDLAGSRLENARELLRYARWRVTLSDRIRILAALDLEGSMTLVDCMSTVRTAADPIGVVAALALRRFVEIDLDSGPLGPETRVTRFRG